MKEIYLHYNPGTQGDTSYVKKVSRDRYYRHYRWGTVYIQEVPENFELMVRLLLQNGIDIFNFHYGESKLDYVDRCRYDKKIGREIATTKVNFQEIKINGIDIKKGLTVIHLQTKIGFNVEIEYNHLTKKYFIQAPSLW